MGNEVVKYAPKAVIDWLDDSNKRNGLVNTLVMYGNLSDLPAEVGEFSYEDTLTDEVLAKHLIGIERLQPEREPKYYVSSEDYDGETVVYFRTDLGIVDYVQYDTVIIYEAGFSKQLAEAIVAEVGGEIKEIK